ncbi:hypothetical protein [Citrobacter portucalensis]|uniref:hypothetical protein n=1 Tax=Citrobacter portucalensis TaxID=1639133 RepID=UPI00226BAD67|nr:hypothetical protein [Citrobacter portucalensis]MCX8984826.1 hypothetical protein [Citrobacter portucalensis]
MEITPSVKGVAIAVQQWALSDGWTPVGVAISERYHYEGGGDLLPATDTQYGLNNAPQRVKRVYQGYEGPRYSHMATELMGPALRAMPVMRSSAVTRPDDLLYLLMVGVKELQDLVAVVSLRGSRREVLKERREADGALSKALDAVLQYEESYFTYEEHVAL